MRFVSIFFVLFSGLSMTSNFPESFDKVDVKYNQKGFQSLTNKEKAIFTIWWLEAEVNNGGFHQYFWNSAGDHALLALEALNNIGASKTANLLENALEIGFSGSYTQERNDRQNILEINEDLKMDKLGALDSKFYEYEENFYEMLDAYVND
tara:strand:- start:11557 stop:12009 length:453 start_codon:yes stop_codon:yes gene_type:complete